MFYYRNRYYHPQLGRFVTRDPVGYDSNTRNLYLLGDSITSAVDPLGLTSIVPAGPQIRRETNVVVWPIPYTKNTDKEVRIEDTGAGDWREIYDPNDGSKVIGWQDSNEYDHNLALDREFGRGNLPYDTALKIDSINDLYFKLVHAARGGTCIRKLALVGHMGEGKFCCGSKANDDGNGNIKASVLCTNPVDAFPVGVWCPDCEIEMHGCAFGSGSNGLRMMHDIHILTGCRIRARRNNCVVDHGTGLTDTKDSPFDVVVP